jgi:hypothetical protein
MLDVYHSIAGARDRTLSHQEPTYAARRKRHDDLAERDTHASTAQQDLTAQRDGWASVTIASISIIA